MNSSPGNDPSFAGTSSRLGSQQGQQQQQIKSRFPQQRRSHLDDMVVSFLSGSQQNHSSINHHGHDSRISPPANLSKDDMKEYKRLKNRLAVRNCRQRKMIEVEQDLRLNLHHVTRQYTKLIVERYQLEQKLKEKEQENAQLRQFIDQMSQQAGME